MLVRDFLARRCCVFAAYLTACISLSSRFPSVFDSNTICGPRTAIRVNDTCKVLNRGHQNVNAPWARDVVLAELAEKEKCLRKPPDR